MDLVCSYVFYCSLLQGLLGSSIIVWAGDANAGLHDSRLKELVLAHHLVGLRLDQRHGPAVGPSLDHLRGGGGGGLASSNHHRLNGVGGRHLEVILMAAAAAGGDRNLGCGGRA